MALTLSSAARLANPSFGNIEQLGQDIGSLSARRRQRGMLTDLMAPLMSGDASQTDYSNVAVQLAQMGDLDRAVQVSQLGQNVGANRRALREQMTQDQLAINAEAKLKKLRQNAIAKADRLADMAGEDSAKRALHLDERSLVSGTSDPKVLEDYLKGSSAFMGDTTFANAGYWTDGTNYWKGVEVRGKKGQTRVDYTPIGNAPDFETWQRENPDKNLSPAGGAYLETAAGKADRTVSTAGKVKGIENFEDFKDEEFSVFTSLQETIATGKDMLAALDQLGPERTGGFLPVTLDKVRQFVGNQDVDSGTFDIYAKQRMINDLRKFGANPTEGERAALAELQPSLLRTEKINRALIEKFMKIANRRYQGIAFLRDNPTATREDYLTFMESQYAADETIEKPPAEDDGPTKVFTFDSKGNLIQTR
tara:strand:- start:1645 stop:2910 length:1266 start_codon:yes stop_codon:yes gene_type:complete